MKYFAIIIAICCLVSGCAISQPGPVIEALKAGEEEQRLWRQAREEQHRINSRGVLYEDAELENYLTRIAQKLRINSTSASDISFQIRVVKDPQLNAIAFPDGVIYVNTGILARMDNEAQLAALLAHEMVHCTHRHSLRALKSTTGQSSSDGTSGQTSERIRMGRELARVFGATGSIAAWSGYTRELETEADRVGLDLVVKANYDPKETLKLFEHLKQEIEREGIEEPYFFGTHPNVQNRIKNIHRWLADKYPASDKGIKNREIFQSRIFRLMLDNARLDLRRGRFLVARKTVEKYLAARPDDARAYFLMGEIFRQWGRHDDAAAAINYFEKSISLNPTLPDPYRAMGLIHYKIGEKRLAKKFFESCLLLSPDAADKTYIENYLKLCANNGEG